MFVLLYLYIRDTGPHQPQLPGGVLGIRKLTPQLVSISKPTPQLVSNSKPTPQLVSIIHGTNRGRETRHEVRHGVQATMMQVREVRKYGRGTRTVTSRVSTCMGVQDGWEQYKMSAGKGVQDAQEQTS